MIEKLDIKNFMLFEELEIPTLKRVNLIGGRNNSGKTAFLQALRIFLGQGDPSLVNSILNDRQVFERSNDESLDAMFNHSIINGNSNSTLIINELFIRRVLNEFEEITYKGGFTDKKKQFPFNSTYHPSIHNDKTTFLGYKEEYNLMSDLWEKIVLTPKEDDVIEIIKDTIEPNLKRLDVGKEKVKMRLKNMIKPVPLGTLGDGVQRILLIALGLANAKNSYLLIDEIELGLHHSVLEKLWTMIFKYAKKWNIQVFVTTHSQDAIRTFTYIASEEQNKEDAQFIRLQIGRTGKNEAILFDTERLVTSLDLALEIR